MLFKILSFSIKNKGIIAMFTIVLAVWGTYALTRLPVDALPDITNNQVQIITKSPTLAAQEVEQFITYPVERSLANVPGLIEIRSISRFGLSVITVVFEESVNIYFARQLIAERLKAAQEQIPAEMGVPEMGPVTTGLGEIYQYTIHPRKGSEKKYNAMDLRTMQDWIVARQLYGLQGVAEVTGFGGETRQYEVAIDPARLHAMHVSIADIYNALEKNNENTGGAYIDHKPNAWYIRGVGIMSNKTDIENTLVKRQSNGIPLFVKDVATVQYGAPPRYGAMTYNGEKEVVGGIVLMLKGANSSEVVSRVKERIAQIQQSLPEDVIIEPFLDRTHLIDRAIHTVEKNLAEGALIVIFVLVVFLGNLRAGLIVASAIPLALLFALGMMHVFGVSANLMSLGAIDFGIIVDGAVIVVEAVMHHLALSATGRKLTQKEMDEEVYTSAAAIRKSAAFGEIIILIVYIPILTLSGIEGRMFRPMAQTVGFAILGALLLSLTYIPMMAAWFLPKQLKHGSTWSDRAMTALLKIYTPLLQKAIKARKVVALAAAALLAVAIFLFTKLGGEFIPQLQEGDYAIEFALPQNASLTQTIETVLQAENIVKRFPEVKTVVGKTGSADAATDPMPPQMTDLIVILKDKEEWRKGKDFFGLANEITDSLGVIPGIIAEPSQPIQMRFNELMTGIRQDVAIKVFGENLDTLSALAGRIATAIKGVPGIRRPQKERVSGLPQITIRYDRARLANYGINITDANKIVQTAFAGYVAGSIYENERRFDIAVRLDSAHRSSITDVRNLFVATADGSQIPLEQVAEITFESGPAQISREDGRRRTVVSFNVDGRDVESVVQDAQQVLAQQVRLPAGYYLTWGGAFENLKQASQRLMIAVPVALLLIFTLLYFTFHSTRQAALIFTSIPMAAIGGVMALMLRDMPFSISAGIGFIALFGVAVLNGIVLIGTFNQLEASGMSNITERVIEGTRMRLRPVLMTATVAALGFLPMALSHSAGAEVQRPLATVVIGGLVSATALTLFVLPLLYLIFTPTKTKQTKNVVAGLLLLICVLPASAQQKHNETLRIRPEAAVDSGLKNNLQLQSSAIAVQRYGALTGAAATLPRTGFFAENEDARPSDLPGILKIGISQSVEWPGVYSARRNVARQHAATAEWSLHLREAAIRKAILTTYYELWYQQSRERLWQQLDSFYTESARVANHRVRTGESAGLDSISATARSMETRQQLAVIKNDIEMAQAALRTLMNTSVTAMAIDAPLGKVTVPAIMELSATHPSLMQQQQTINAAGADVQLTRRSMMPELSGRFFSQRLYGLPDPYSGFSVSVGIPLLSLSGMRHKVTAARLEQSYQETVYEQELQQMQTQLMQTRLALEKSRNMLRYYEQTGLIQANAITDAATKSYLGGVISFAEMSQYLNQAMDIRKNHLEALHQYNEQAIQLNYLINK